MKRSRQDCYILSGPAADALTKDPVGKLTPAITHHDAATPCTLLDSFDQSLRRSGRVLIDLGPSFDLMLPDGQMLSQPIKGKPRFVADFNEGPVKTALADLSPLRSLLPVGSGTLSRTTVAFLDNDQKIHCRAVLHLLTGPEDGATAIVTLQGLRGYDKALDAARTKIKASGGIALTQGALTRIYPAADDCNPKPAVDFPPGHSAFDVATDIIAANLAVARLTEAGIMADLDTEFLHDYRVALRKVRSALSLFKGTYQPEQTADLKAHFASLMAQTGPLRDLDVYLLEKKRYYDLLPAHLHAGLDAMFAILSAQRLAAWTTLIRHLRGKRHAREMSGLADLFATRTHLKPGPAAKRTAYGFACALIWKRYNKIRQIADSIGPQTPDTEVHLLRIHCKKLRYLMEFFACLFPKPGMMSLLKPLKILQDHLGLVNDLSVQHTNLQKLLPVAGPSTNLAVAQCVGALTLVLHKRQNEERHKTIAVIAAFSSRHTQQTFRDLFHARKKKP